MRIKSLAAAAVLSLSAFAFAAPPPAIHSVFQAKPASARQIALQAGKPGLTGGGAAAGNDSCRWANDRECDEPGIGTGACQPGTDRSDCQYIRFGERDACQWARDGECDEPQFGTGACVMGSDRTDCGDVSHLRFRNDSCEHAFNNVCDERGMGGTGRCADRTDRADCVGRERPMTISDHYFGRDDRVRVNTAETPWAQVGLLRMSAGTSCTATLVGEDVIVTAAHCLHGDGGRLNARGEFIAASTARGGPHRANITAYYFDPTFNYQRFNTTDEIDGTDWALLRLDRPLGRTIGYLEVQNALGPPGRGGQRPDLYQAGYGWDTGDFLAGNVRCRVLEVFRDSTFAHNCDTTRGDSGSALIARVGERYVVAGVDSNFRSNPGGGNNSGSFLYIAASAQSFERYVVDFRAGRIGRSISGATAGGVRK